MWLFKIPSAWFDLIKPPSINLHHNKEKYADLDFMSGTNLHYLGDLEQIT